MGGSSHKAYAAGEYFTEEAYGNHWGRSDVRAWLNGLTPLGKDGGKTLPTDGSRGKPSTDDSSKNFLNYFTSAELELFEAKNVTTNVFDELTQPGTVSAYDSTDLFWLPTGSYDSEEVLSTDYKCDLSWIDTYDN